MHVQRAANKFARASLAQRLRGAAEGGHQPPMRARGSFIFVIPVKIAAAMMRIGPNGMSA